MADNKGLISPEEYQKLSDKEKKEYESNLNKRVESSIPTEKRVDVLRPKLNPNPAMPTTATMQKAKDSKESSTSTVGMKKTSTGDSLVAKKYGDKKEKTWDDVKKENGNDPVKIAEWMNNNPSYKAGNLTKKGMEEFGYSLDENGKWSTKTNATANDALDGIESITSKDKTIQKEVDSFTNPETGDVDTEKAKGAINAYEQKLVESGAAYYDENGKFTFKPTNEKGWETWATMLSVGLSAVGLAMGVPIIPINFRAITGKDAKDAQIKALQQQYLNIMADDASKVSGMNADVEAGNVALNNQKALAAQEKHAQATAAQKDVIGAQKDAEKELIETRTDAEIRKDVAQFNRDMKRLESDRDFQLKYASLQQQYAKEMAELQDALSTKSAIDVMKFQNSGFLKDLKDMGMSFSDIASYTAAKNGISPADKNWNRVKMTSDMVNDLGNTTANILDQFTLF